MRNNSLHLADAASIDSLSIPMVGEQTYKHNGQLVHCHEGQDQEEQEAQLSEAEGMAAQLMRRILRWTMEPENPQTRLVRLYLLAFELWGYFSSYRSISRAIGCHQNQVSLQALDMRRTFPLFRAKRRAGLKQRRK